MKRYSLWLLAAGMMLLAGCALHRTPDQYAHSFFEDGKESIMKALKNQDATPAQLDQARAILNQNEPTVTGNIAVLLSSQQNVLLGVTSGNDTTQLLALEEKMHQAHQVALRSIGKMHGELQAAVGEKIWSAATAQMGQKMARYLKK
ncbi:MAG: hypothetical protein ACYDDO_05160 [Acidiferrobacterales bacterium]